MRITLQTDYALRILIYLATHPDRLVTTREVADAYSISHDHLLKIARRLTEGEIVESIRGRNGGLRLAQDATAINIGDLFRRFEPGMVLVECFDKEVNTCPIIDACSLKGVLQIAEAEFIKVLDRYCLSDLVRSPERYIKTFATSN